MYRTFFYDVFEMKLTEAIGETSKSFSGASGTTQWESLKMRHFISDEKSEN